MNNWWVWIWMFLLPRRWWYRNMYLWSSHWRNLRSKKLRKIGFRCERCKSPNWRALDVHHLTYQRIWHERLSDLQVLCRKCHTLEHSKHEQAGLQRKGNKASGTRIGRISQTH